MYVLLPYIYRAYANERGYLESHYIHDQVYTFTYPSYHPENPEYAGTCFPLLLFDYKQFSSLKSEFNSNIDICYVIAWCQSLRSDVIEKKIHFLFKNLENEINEYLFQFLFLAYTIL